MKQRDSNRWTRSQFLAILAIIAAIQGVDFCNQGAQRSEIVGHLEERIDDVGSLLDECRQALEECNRWFRSAVDRKVE